MYSLEILSCKEIESYILGELFSKIINSGFIIFLNGALGTGKTTISRGIIHGLLNSSDISVKSPTFSIVELYKKNNMYIYHFDLYRLKTYDDLYYIGFSDYFKYGYVFILEWAEKFVNLLPKPHLIVNINILDGKSRFISLKSNYINLKKLFG